MRDLINLLIDHKTLYLQEIKLFGHVLKPTLKNFTENFINF